MSSEERRIPFIKEMCCYLTILVQSKNRKWNSIHNKDSGGDFMSNESSRRERCRSRRRRCCRNEHRHEHFHFHQRSSNRYSHRFWDEEFDF